MVVLGSATTKAHKTDRNDIAGARSRVLWCGVCYWLMTVSVTVIASLPRCSHNRAISISFNCIRLADI